MIKANRIGNKSKNMKLNNSKVNSSNKTTKDTNNKVNSYTFTSQLGVNRKKVKCKGEKINCCIFFK